MAQLSFVLVAISFFIYISLAEDLNLMKKNFDKFYNDLIKKYDTIEFDDSTKQLIDQEVDQYHKIILKQFQNLHSKNEFLFTKNKKKDLDFFQKFDEVMKLNVSKIEDVLFLNTYIGQKQWFGVILSTSNVKTYEIRENKFFLATEPYFVENGTQIYHIKSLKGTFIMAVKPKSISIIYFYFQDKKYFIREIQNLNVSHAISHFSCWKYNDQVFLGVATSSKIYIYTLLEKSVHLLQTIPLYSRFLFPYQIKESIFLVTSGRRKTIIFRYTYRQFETYKTIHKSSIDAAIMSLKNNQYLLCLSSEEQTIVYDLLEDKKIFFPIQKIPAANQILSMVRNNTALLIMVNNSRLSVYQFNGWMFVKIHYEMKGVRRIRLMSFLDEDHILIEKIDGTWSLHRPEWTRIDDQSKAREYRKMKQWCLDYKDKINNFSKTDEFNRFIYEYGIKFKVNKVNEIDTIKLKNLTDRYEQLTARITEINKSLNQPATIENPRFTNLQAQTVRIKCSNNCRVKKLLTNVKCDFLSKAGLMKSKTETLRFEHVKVNKLDGFICPEVGVKIKEVNVKGLINGIHFDDFYKKVLRTAGDQIITGEHIFENLNVSSLVAPNIDVASTHSRQKIKSSEIHAKELILPDGGLLLPIDGEPVTMTGTLTVARAKFDGPVHLRGRLRGSSIKRFSPMIDFLGAHELSGNYTFNNVRVMGNLAAFDVTRKRGKSIKNIKKEALPLTSDVPVRLFLKNNNTIWKNISLDNFPNWLTKNSSEIIEVTGKKIALNDVTMPDFLHSNLPIPKLRTPTCSITAAVSNIKTSIIKVDESKAKFVKINHVDGEKQLHGKLNNSVKSLNESDCTRKSFSGVFRVDNLNIVNLDYSPFWSFLKADFIWSDPNLIKGPLRVKNLKTVSLKVPEGVKIPCPLKVGNMFVEGNLKVQKINGIILDEYMKNIARINDTIFMKKLFFDYLEVEEIHATDSNIDLQDFEENIYLGNKIISHNLEIEEDLSIPDIFSFPSETNVTTYIIEGSVKFENEPNISNFNGKNLQELFSGIWIINRSTKLMENYIFQNLTLAQFSSSLESFLTPKFDSWKTLENRILSKIKLQEIGVPAYIKIATVPNIVARENSSLLSSDRYLNEFFFNTLKIHKNQNIEELWTLNELIISDHIQVMGKINNLNFSTDVARHSVEFNKINGKKVVGDLIARNFVGLNFKNWAKNVFVPSNYHKLIIDGKKKFDSFAARTLNVDGTITGKKLNDCLQQNVVQDIPAAKIIQGSLHAESFFTKGSLNNINFTKFVNDQLKKYEKDQTIKSTIVVKKDFTILGNLTVEKKLEGIDLEKLDSMYEIFIPSARAVKYLEPFVKTINDVTLHSAKYWNKFEQIEENFSLVKKKNVSNDKNFNSKIFFKLGHCVLQSPEEIECDRVQKFFLKSFITNTTNILINQLLSVEKTPLVVQVSSGPNSRISFFAYSNITNSFEMPTSIRAPGIREASALPLNNIVWIVARLKSDMLVVRYEPLGATLYKYHLRPSQFFSLDLVPASNELVLVRDDGMWKLDGLDGPRHVFKVSVEADEVETIASKNDFYVRMKCKDGKTTLLQARYVGV